MTFEYVTGDLFDIDVRAIAHGCNCRGAMGAGVARLVKNRHPGMYQQYKKLCDEGLFGLGSVFPWIGGSLVRPKYDFVYNLGTQYDPGPNASLDGIYWSMDRMFAQAEKSKVESIAVPRIGAGIGGLKWDNVRQVMERLSGKHPTVKLVVVTHPSDLPTLVSAIGVKTEKSDFPGSQIFAS